jgi:hypothetical protein
MYIFNIIYIYIMTEFTPQYGAITSIIDNTTFYSMKDIDDIEFTFEVYPLSINENQIQKAIESTGRNDIWIIDYITKIISPSSNEIEKAIEMGILIKLSIICEFFDNYGQIHTISFNKEHEIYDIKINKYMLLSQEYIPFNNKLISIIKENKNKKKIIFGLSQNNRFLFGTLFEQLDKQNKLIILLEDRIKILESK